MTQDNTTTEEPRWKDCTVAQWEKKAELSMLNGEMGEAMKFADYANCREMYDNGVSINEIQDRFNHD